MGNYSFTDPQTHHQYRSLKGSAVQDTLDQTDLARQLAPYVPRWLLKTLSESAIEPGYAQMLEATVFYADLSGFTPLTEALSERGPQGVEALNQILNTVFGSIVETLRAFEGDVVEFSGDAITAFWPQIDRNTVLQAAGAAQAIQVMMQRFNPISTPVGDLPLTLRMGLGVGPTTLLIVGNEEQRYCVLSGTALMEATTAEGQARENQIVLSVNARTALEQTVAYNAAGLMEQMLQTIPPRHPRPLPLVLPERLKPFVPQLLVERLQQGQGAFLADFRHAVTLLFVSFDAITPTEVQEYVVTALACVNQHGGFLSEVEIGNKGNVLVILFGAPLSLGDNAARAAACAWTLATIPGTRSIGGSTGAVLSGVIGGRNRRQYTAAGSEVILSARLMVAARNAPTQPAVLLSNRIVKQTQRRFMYGETQWLQVKGRPEPVAACWLLGPATTIFATTDETTNMPLIGRVYELTQIKSSIERVRAGQGQTLFISGDMGIGKSRLAAALLHEWQALRGQAYCAAAQPLTQAEPYAVWRPLLYALLEITTKSESSQIAEITALFKTNAPRWLPRLPLLAPVLNLALPDSPQTQTLTPLQRYQGAQYFTLELLRMRADKHPLMLIIEDLQWIDRASWELIFMLVQALSSWSLLLCLTYRPQITHILPGHAKLTALSHSLVLPLTPFSPDELTQYIQTRLGIRRVPQDLLALVQTNTQGHPYFTEELLSALSDQGKLMIQRGAARLLPATDTLRLPDSIRGVIQAQLDDLDQNTRFTLKVVAVIGQCARYDLLHAIHPMEPSHKKLLTQLDELVERQILTREIEKNITTYSFCNTITQEVTYATLPFAQRRMIHRAIAEWYQQTDGAPPCELLAHHYQLAGDTEHATFYAKMAE